MTISLAQQIDEIDRELKMRAQVYPGLVRSGKLRQSIADYQVERLRAARETLIFLRDNEQTVREAVKAKRGPA